MLFIRCFYNMNINNNDNDRERERRKRNIKKPTEASKRDLRRLDPTLQRTKQAMNLYRHVSARRIVQQQPRLHLPLSRCQLHSAGCHRTDATVYYSEGDARRPSHRWRFVVRAKFSTRGTRAENAR